MAIYHFHAQVISRSDGRSAVAAAAYRSGSVLTDLCGVKHDYSKKRGVVHTQIFVPDGCPFIEREELWCLAERTEKRKNSCLAREGDIALPVELSEEERVKVAAEFCQWLTDEYGVAVDCCQHRGGKDNSGADANPHIHWEYPLRPFIRHGLLPSLCACPMNWRLSRGQKMNSDHPNWGTKTETNA